MMAGGAGSMAATLAGPVVAVDDELAGPVLLAGRHLPRDGAALLFAVVPERPAPRHAGNLRDQFRVTGVVLTDGFYWRIQPLLAVQQLAFIGCISLWIGPWLRDVGGIADTGERADIQLYATAATALGFGASGLISGWCRRVGDQRFRLRRHHQPAVRAGLRLARLPAAEQSASSRGCCSASSAPARSSTCR